MDALTAEDSGQLRAGDRLTVVEFSRLGRSTSKLKELLDDLERRGIALRVLSAGIDTSTEPGKVAMCTGFDLAESTLDQIPDRSEVQRRLAEQA